MSHELSKHANGTSAPTSCDELKIEEHALREYQYFFNNSQDFSCVANMNGYFELLNPNFEKVLGYSIEELLENPFLTFFHPDDLPTTLQEFEKVKSGAITINFINRIRKKDGDYLWFDWNASPDPSSGKVYAIARDITERRKVIKSLTEYEYFFNSSTDFFCIVNQIGYYDKVNPTFEKLLGYSTNEILTNPVFDITHADDLEPSLKEFEKLKSGATILSFENRARKKDGSYVWIEWRASPDLATGKLYAVGRDITKSKEEVERNNKLLILESKSKEMEQFAYIASHDLREPLLTIKNYIQILTEDFGDNLQGESWRYMQSIYAAANRMEVLISGLLDYSRLSIAKQLQQVVCYDIVKEALDDLNSNISSSNAHIVVGTMPVLKAYPLELKLLFQNLVHNAIKFKAKDAFPEIAISSKEINGGWQFEISDNGIGIDKKNTERIFSIFQRLHSGSEYEGTGIGLAHCKKIAELHNGNIWVESTLGKGSNFYFTILI